MQLQSREISPPARCPHPNLIAKIDWSNGRDCLYKRAYWSTGQKTNGNHTEGGGGTRSCIPGRDRNQERIQPRRQAIRRRTDSKGQSSKQDFVTVYRRFVHRRGIQNTRLKGPQLSSDMSGGA